MITGIGLDIEDINRFRKLQFQDNKGFYTKTFTQNEINYCLKTSDPYERFAVRFCAKEAFMKALGRRLEDYSDVEVISVDGVPQIMYQGEKHMLSLSHDKEKAVAMVVIQK